MPFMLVIPIPAHQVSICARQPYSWHYAIAGDAQRGQSGAAPTPPPIIPSIVTYGTSTTSLPLSSTGTGKTYSQTYSNAYRRSLQALKLPARLCKQL